ncbi:hypothetical protein Mal52_44100 [Symmachiella dynata]|uniref:N-acetyltransferase domain-containing protein n=1 Tax=Symmachiella dynata TaxID=2527995 RepID=A0A517ZTW5_9PLAN|nr:GNAT family N-acetyltransferase [Symmachiella dynata]QDU45913.1 hypothetical protein Mal52_44100 [Symmachiella dynata]
MTDTLDVHPASPDEVVVAHRNVYDIWSKGRSLEEHIQYRLNADPHRRATWFVGCAGRHVATSLGSYPVEFQVRGETIPGFAIGSVYTCGEYRGKGYAAKLIEGVEQQLAERGMRLSILYSDIAAEYYAAMGYRLCPASAGWRYLSTVTKSNTDEILTEFQEADDFAAMSAMYHDYHGATPFSIRRSDDYWRAMSSKFPEDRFFWLKAEDGSNRGYVRLTPDPHGWRILDYACADQTNESLSALYQAVLSLTAGWDVDRCGGWLPNNPITNDLFEVKDRKSEITMIKSLDPALVIDDEIIAAADRFCEMDHV